MINRQNMLIVEKDGEQLSALTTMVSSKFKVVTTFSFSKAQSFIDSSRASIILSDVRNCDQASLINLEHLVEKNPLNPVVIVAAKKAQELLIKKIGEKSNIFYVDSPIDKAKLLKICIESFDKITKQEDTSAEPKQNPVSLNIPLAPYLFRSLNRKPVESRSVSVEPTSLIIICDEEFRTGSQLLIVIQGKGVALKVEKCNPNPNNAKEFTCFLSSDKDTNLLELFASEGLIAKPKEKEEPIDKSPESEVKNKEPTIIDGISIPAVLPQSILFVDDDEYINKTIENIFRENDVKVFKGYLDPLQAWNDLCKNRYDAIVIDWMMPKISGLALLCRLRSDPYYQNIPILIVSGFVAKNDFGVLADFHLVKLLEKPFAAIDLIKNLTLLMHRSNQWQILLKNTEAFIAHEKWKKDEDVNITKLMQFISQPPDVSYHCFAAAQVLAFYGMVKTAEELYKKALPNQSHQAKVMYALGKMYADKGMNKEAKIILAKAHKISPMNLCRLHDMGRAYMNDLDMNTAQKIYLEIRKNDPDNHTATQALLLAKNVSNWLMNAKDVPQTFAGILNSVGIDFVHANKMKDGIIHYKEAISFLNDPVSKSKLAFNLALAFKKVNRLEDCLFWLEQAVSFDPSFDKPKRHISIIKGLKDLDPKKDGSTISSSHQLKKSLNEIEESKEPPGEEKVKLLYKASPDLATYFRALTGARINVDRAMPRFVFFYDKYGEKKFAAAIKKALEDKIYSVDYVADILRKKRVEAGEGDSRHIRTILVLDSENSFNKSLKPELEKFFSKVLIEQDFEKVIGLVQDKSLEKPQLILIADNLPGKDPIKVVYQIKGDPILGDIPIILLVDSVDPQKMSTASSVGVEDFCIRSQGNSAILAKIQLFMGS